jgi:hypothetical protein
MRIAVSTLIIAVCGACQHADDTAAVSSPPVLSIATQNAGTTTYLDMVADSPAEAVREVCSTWYSNNLCVEGTETQLADAVSQEAPDLLFLQEMWDQASCDDDDRPGEANLAPFVCSLGSDNQLSRVLPADWWWGCAGGYPDNCVAFPPALTTPTGCDGQDCSSLVVSHDGGCGDPGRIAYWELDTSAGPLVAVVVHTNAGMFEDDIACRAQQLDSIAAVLAALPPETSIAMAGDFNLDPELYESGDAEAFASLVADLGLSWLGGYDESHRISHVKLDHVLVRGAALATGQVCEARYLDEGEADVMLDHAWVGCR